MKVEEMTISENKCSEMTILTVRAFNRRHSDVCAR